ncbi:bifunctional biotin operon repressor/biotin--[acetyl-CoA-carboxylase] ligase [Pasteurellaceae bacterium Pebbles2]|nr:bifunctional biotin operon repressor/biotin--[acetyl-CoA-carboxylase] ligase [Pasteurellaceae bacterium Pebbles2]
MNRLFALIADCQPKTLENLTALLGCKRTELAQHIEQLQQQGIPIQIEHNTLCLQPRTALLNINQLQQAVACPITYVPIIHSTNQFLLDKLKTEPAHKGELCLAEQQTAGRGRRGRQWISPFASQLMFSFVWQIDARKSLEGLSLVVAMAIHKALAQFDCNNIELKWPNDILLQDRKLTGILIEIAHTQNGKINSVIGIGMNIDIPMDNQQITQPWANLSEILPKIDRTFLLITLINHIYTELDQFEQQGISEKFQQEWRNVDRFFGEEVNIIKENAIISGIEQGIDERGYLKLLTYQGELLCFNGGEVSLRKKTKQ